MNIGDAYLPDVIDAPELRTTTKSGRASFDERGNTVWEWQTEPGVFSREISSQELQRLAPSDLQIIDASSLSAAELTAWNRSKGAFGGRTRRGTSEVVLPIRKQSAAGTGFIGDMLRRFGLAT